MPPSLLFFLARKYEMKEGERERRARARAKANRTTRQREAVAKAMKQRSNLPSLRRKQEEEKDE